MPSITTPTPDKKVMKMLRSHRHLCLYVKNPNHMIHIHSPLCASEIHNIQHIHCVVVEIARQDEQRASKSSSFFPFIFLLTKRRKKWNEPQKVTQTWNEPFFHRQQSGRGKQDNRQVCNVSVRTVCRTGASESTVKASVPFHEHHCTYSCRSKGDGEKVGRTDDPCNQSS